MPLFWPGSVQGLGLREGGDIIGADPAYRSNALEILGIHADDRFPLVQGPTGFVYAGWLPDDEFLRREYEEASDYSGSLTETPPYRQFLLDFAGAFLDEANAVLSKRLFRLLDYGCGHGQLLRMLASRDIDAFGYEPTVARLEWSHGGTILSDLSEVAKVGPFDLFICTEVLEHLAKPREALAFFHANAAPGALLAITVPGCSPEFVTSRLAQAETGGPFPAVLNPFEHLNQFNAITLRAMLAEEDWRVVRDFGRARGATLAAGRFGSDGRIGDFKNVARVAKRALTAEPTTHVFCTLA